MSIHDWFRIPFVLLAVLSLGTACTPATEPAAGARESEPTMDTLVTAEWLGEHLGDPGLVVLDCTVTVEQTEDGDFQIVNGRPSYQAGHIPGAGFADLMAELSDTDSPYEHDLPTPEQFAAAMGALGVGDGTRVVLYDNYNSSWAARVWWMLRWIGFDDAAVLDGGLKAWKDAGRPLSTDPANYPGRTLTVALRPGLFADGDEVHAAIGDDAVNIIDSLPEAHYRGDWALYDRPGHITTATNVPVTSLTDDSGRFKPDEELATLFGYDRDARNIVYCGGGIAASSDAFVMTRLGFTDVAVYVPSLQEWAADPDLPMETATEFDEFPEQ
jgi:thiosulfate/3-mercaptopyruvate sulfurtransferase